MTAPYKTSATGSGGDGEAQEGLVVGAVSARRSSTPAEPTTGKKTRHRKRRGADTQRIVAAYLREHGYPHATDAGAGRGGRDILNVEGVAVEVKARRDLSLPAWLRQCQGTCDGDLPVVVHRPDGFGPARVADWPVTMRLEDFVALIEPVMVDGAVVPRA